jgi:hypothetical protein
MIKVTVQFYVGTAYIRSEVKETKVIEVYPEEDMTEAEIEELIETEKEEAYNEWLWNKIETGSKEISREVIEEEDQ